MLYELELESRRSVYGASELGALHGVDPFLDLHAMYLRKMHGLVSPPTKRQMYGKIFEEAILYAFGIEIGRKFNPSFNKTYRHPDPRFHLVATPDGMPEDESDGGVDCKMVAWDQRHQWGPTADDIPARVELQVRGCMAVTDKPRWYVALWCGDRLSIYVIERDREFEGFILERSEQQWKKYFEAGEMPPIGGSPLTSQWLQQAYPKNRKPLRIATEDEVALLSRYGTVRREQKVLKGERAALENQLKAAIKDHDGLEWPGGRFTWRRTKDGSYIDWESMAIALRTHYVRDPDPATEAAARDKVTEDHRRPRPGRRRIWFSSTDDSDDEEEADDAAA